MCTLWLNAGMRDFLVLICGREGVKGMPCFGENVEFNMFGKHKKGNITLHCPLQHPGTLTREQGLSVFLFFLNPHVTVPDDDVDVSI